MSWHHHKNCGNHTLLQSQTLGKYLQVRRTSYFWNLRPCQLFTVLFIKNKTIFINLCLTNEFQIFSGAFKFAEWVRQYLHGPGKPSKYNCLQGANFHRSLAWQIVLIFNTVISIDGLILSWTIIFRSLGHITSTYFMTLTFFLLRVIQYSPNYAVYYISYIQNNPMPCNTMSINSFPPSAAYIREWIRSALVQIMVCRLFGTKPLSKPVLGCCQLHPMEQISMKF